MSLISQHSQANNRSASPDATGEGRKLSKALFRSFPKDDTEYEVIAVGRVGDGGSRHQQVSAELLLAPYQWEKRDTAEIIPVKRAAVAVGLLPAFLPHTRWRGQTFAGDLDPSGAKSGMVELHPKAQAGGNPTVLLPEVLTSDCIGWPEWKQGRCHPHPISALIGMPLFRILIDGREAYVPVIEVMRKAFMPDTFWARYLFELGWQRPVPTARAFGSIYKAASATGFTLKVEAFSHFRKYSTKPLAIWGSDPVCSDAVIRMGTSLQSDGYLLKPVYAHTRFPFPKPTRWDYHSVTVIAPGYNGRSSVVWEIVTRIFRLDYDHGIESIDLGVPTTVSSGSKPARRPAEEPDDTDEPLEIDDEAQAFFARATQEFITSETDDTPEVPVTRTPVNWLQKDSTKALKKVYAPPAVVGTTADHSGSDVQTAQVIFSNSTLGAPGPSMQTKPTLKSSIQSAGAQLQMRFEDVPGSELGGRWLFEADAGVHRSAWPWMKTSKRAIPVPRPFEVCCLLGDRWRIYFFESVISAHEQDNGSHARAIGMLRTPVRVRLSREMIRDIAKEWADAKGTWVKAHTFFERKRLLPIAKVKHHKGADEQVSAIISQINLMI